MQPSPPFSNHRDYQAGGEDAHSPATAAPTSGSSSGGVSGGVSSVVVSSSSSGSPSSIVYSHPHSPPSNSPSPTTSNQGRIVIPPSMRRGASASPIPTPLASYAVRPHPPLYTHASSSSPRGGGGGPVGGGRRFGIVRQSSSPRSPLLTLVFLLIMFTGALIVTKEVYRVVGLFRAGPSPSSSSSSSSADLHHPQQDVVGDAHITHHHRADYRGAASDASSFTRRALPINVSLVGINRLRLDSFMVLDYEEDVCRSVGAHNRQGPSPPPQQQQHAAPFILPRCAADVPLLVHYQDEPEDTAGNEKGGAPPTDMCAHIFHPSTAVLNGAPPPHLQAAVAAAAAGPSPPFPYALHAGLPYALLGRYMMKVLKLLLTNRGCDQVVDPILGATDRAEFLSIIRTEHNNEFTILNLLGGGEDRCDAVASVESDLLTPSPAVIANDGLGLDALPRINIMSLKRGDHSAPAASARSSGAGNGGASPSVAAAAVQGRSTGLDWAVERLALSAAQPSSMAATCYEPSSTHASHRGGGGWLPWLWPFSAAESSSSDGSGGPSSSAESLLGALAVIPSGSFNAVMGFDRLRHIIVANTAGDGGGGESGLCAVVTELLRVTKVGGAVWAGHIEDPLQIEALSKCRVGAASPSRSVAPSSASSPLPYSFDGCRTYRSDIGSNKGDSASASGGAADDGATAASALLRDSVTMTSVSDRGWMSKIGLPKWSTRKGLRSFVWRRMAYPAEEEDGERAVGGGGKRVGKGALLKL